MNDSRRPDLSEAFTRIISMVLASIRARGWRGLKELPAILLTAMCWRRMGEAFAALVADFRAGRLLPRAPAPAPEIAPAAWTEPPERQAAHAQPPAPPRPTARPDPVARARRPPTERQAMPAASAEPDRPRARARAVVRPSRRARVPFAVLALPVGILVSGRSP